MTASAKIDMRDQVEPGRQMGVLDAIRTRRSIGKVGPEIPSREIIEEVLEAAIWAPNHHLTQPWRFFVLTGDARHRLGDAMARGQAARATGDGPAVRLDKLRAKPLRAPVIIAVAVEPPSTPKSIEIEEVSAGAAAIQNMLLAAHALGLAAMWRTGNACYTDEVKAFFDLAPAAHLLGFIYLGYPSVIPAERARVPAHALTTWLD